MALWIQPRKTEVGFDPGFQTDVPADQRVTFTLRGLDSAEYERRRDCTRRMDEIGNITAKLGTWILYNLRRGIVAVQGKTPVPLVVVTEIGPDGITEEALVSMAFIDCLSKDVRDVLARRIESLSNVSVDEVKV